MWISRSHSLAPLTITESNKRKFEWTKVKKYAFKKIKQIVACDTLLTYPYFNKAFKIHTDASVFQLGAVIIQKGRPLTL